MFDYVYAPGPTAGAVNVLAQTPDRMLLLFYQLIVLLGDFFTGSSLTKYVPGPTLVGSSTSLLILHMS